MSQHVVVGAGPVGTATARLLADAGRHVVVVSRSGSGPDHPLITRTAGDASSPATMARLAAGAAAIYNCANPPYHRWVTLWPPIAAALLSAAESSGAVLATASNLYAYGPVDGLMTPDLPLATTGPKGQVRARMWQEAAAAHDAGRARVTEVRASDYLCPGPNSHLGDRVVPRVLAGKKVHVMRSADQPHTWTCVQDVARLLVTVAGDERAWGRVWHVPSHDPRTQRQVVAELCRVAGVAPVVVAEHAPALMRALGLVNPVIREFREVAHQFERPFVLDATATRERFGLVPTPWDDGLRALVEFYRR